VLVEIQHELVMRRVTKMKKAKAKSIMFSCLLLTGCAQKQTRIWIEPPLGARSVQAQGIVYTMEDTTGTGGRRSMVIPVGQIPEKFVIDDLKTRAEGESELASATKADKQIQDGKLSVGTKPEMLTISYLRGLSDVEGLYQKKLYSEALVKLAPLIEQYPQQPRLFVMQGTLFRKISENKLALDSYKKAQELDKGNPVIEEALFRIQDEMRGNL
jgi:hypothetical protein